MFEFFPDNYNWSLAVALAVGMGGELSEINLATASLTKAAGEATTDAAQQVWVDAWLGVAEQVRVRAETDEARGRVRSAARAWRRVAIYELMAERMLSNVEPAKNATYRRAVAATTKWRETFLPDSDKVDVPFEESVLSSIFVPAVGHTGSTKSPAVIVWNGFDVTKEFLLFMGVHEWTQRGISVLICDQPGSGESLRLHGLHARLDTEVAASACIDYLATRIEVDVNRIGIVGISMGGYFAPRAAAFEPRLKACAAWGAFHSLAGVMENLAATGAHSAPPFQGPWVFGMNETTDVAAILNGMTLEEVAPNIRCPILIVHGENDRQVPVAQAHRTYELATGAARRDLVVIAAGEPGDQHCQVDLPSLAIDTIGDWFSEVL
jgi:dienelactone hydrolase